jgi:hypothetical protein
LLCLEREREREDKSESWGGVVREATTLRGQENNIFGFEGSQAVPTSPSGRGEACIQDLFKIVILMERNLL